MKEVVHRHSYTTPTFIELKTMFGELNIEITLKLGVQTIEEEVWSAYYWDEVVHTHTPTQWLGTGFWRVPIYFQETMEIRTRSKLGHYKTLKFDITQKKRKLK